MKHILFARRMYGKYERRILEATLELCPKFFLCRGDYQIFCENIEPNIEICTFFLTIIITKFNEYIIMIDL